VSEIFLIIALYVSYIFVSATTEKDLIVPYAIPSDIPPGGEPPLMMMMNHRKARLCSEVPCSNSEAFIEAEAFHAHMIKRYRKFKVDTQPLL
jgi:hypothetical protein